MKSQTKSIFLTLGFFVALTLAAMTIIPEKADAQLFSRLFQRRCCPQPCPQPCPPCCIAQPVSNYSSNNYGTYGRGGNFIYGSGNFSNNPGMASEYDASVSQNQSGVDGNIGHPITDSTVNEFDNGDNTAPVAWNNDSYVGQTQQDNLTDGSTNPRFGDAASQEKQPAFTQPRGQSPQLDSSGQQIQTGSVEDQNQIFTSIYAGKLFLANQCTIELSRIAEEKSTNDDVKQFAEKLGQAHQQLNEKLRSLAPNEIVSAFPKNDDDGSNRDSALTGNNSVVDQRQIDEAGQVPSSGRTTVGRASYDTPTGSIVQKLAQIEHQAAKNGLESVKRMLTESSEQEFDMGFVGIEIASQTQMLAQLEAIKDVGSDELQQIVSSATQSVSSHLEEARKLARKLADERTPDDRDGN